MFREATPIVTIEVVETMLDYNYALNRRLWDSIMTLTDEQFTADVPYSHGSIRNHMLHLATVDGGWLRGLQELPDARDYRHCPADFPTRQSVYSLCERTARDVMAFVASLDDDDLLYQPRGLPLATWQTLLHLANHGTDHRAQVLRALCDMGAPTFDQDLMYYFIHQ